MSPSVRTSSSAFWHGWRSGSRTFHVQKRSELLHMLSVQVKTVVSDAEDDGSTFAQQVYRFLYVMLPSLPFSIIYGKSWIWLWHRGLKYSSLNQTTAHGIVYITHSNIIRHNTSPYFEAAKWSWTGHRNGVNVQHSFTISHIFRHQICGCLPSVLFAFDSWAFCTNAFKEACFPWTTEHICPLVAWNIRWLSAGNEK